MNVEARLLHTGGDDCGPTAVGVMVDDRRQRSGRPLIMLVTPRDSYGLDENHADALVLALQAAIAEVQARAVSR